MYIITDFLCLLFNLFSHRYLTGRAVEPKGVPSRLRVASNLLSSFLGLYTKFTLQVISVGCGFYSKRMYLSREGASMEVTRGGGEVKP